MPCAERHDVALIDFTRDGRADAGRYSWAVLQGHIDELLTLQHVATDAAAAARALVLYRSPLASLLALCVWQLVCVAPQFLLSCIPLALLIALGRSYAASRRTTPKLHRPPSIWDVWLVRLAIGRPTHLNWTPADAAGARRRRRRRSSPRRRRRRADVARGSRRRSRRRRRASLRAAEPAGAAAAAAAPARAIAAAATAAATAAAAASAPAAAADAADPRAPSVVEAALSNPVVGLATGAAGLATDAANLTAEIAESGIRAVANLDLSDITRLVNPIALYLGPVQRTLGENMGYVRAARAVGNWEDTALTGWVCLALLVAAVVLPFVPWQPLLQLCGLALLGPRMWLVGRRVALGRPGGGGGAAVPKASPEERGGWWPQRCSSGARRQRRSARAAAAAEAKAAKRRRRSASERRRAARCSARHPTRWSRAPRACQGADAPGAAAIDGAAAARR